MSNFDNFVGTREVSDTHRFDVPALENWLSANMQDFKGPLQVEMFKGGQSNPTYKLITPSKSYVMRAKPGPVAKLLPSAHAIEREFARPVQSDPHACGSHLVSQRVRRRSVGSVVWAF